MPFVDPDRIEQSDRVQAASFAPPYQGMSSSSSIKRHNYSVSIKLEVIDRYRELNKNMSKTSKEFNIPRSVIYGLSY